MIYLLKYAILVALSILHLFRSAYANCHPASTSFAPPQHEIDALIQLYASTTRNGPWTSNCGWDTIGTGSMSNPCTWPAIKCGPAYKVGLNFYSSVTSFSIYVSNNMVGTLPNSIGNLTQMQIFIIYLNSISGTIPSSVGNWKLLLEFSFYEVPVTGTLPQEVKLWKNLQFIELYSCSITGSLDAVYSSWRNLTYISLSYVPISGTLPDAPMYWKQLTKYEFLVTRQYGKK